MEKIRLKKHKNIILITKLICIIAIIFSAYKITFWYTSNKENQEIKNKNNDSITINKTDNDFLTYDIDWETLKNQNPDTIAYLRVNGTNIDYVVVKGTDNSYYLKHNFNKEYNTAGWIFLDYHNKFDGTDRNTIIYGHNTQDNSMFGSLKNALNESWYNNEDNLIIDLVSEEGLKKFKVFSVYTIEKEDYYITTEFNSDNEYLDFLNTIKNRSINDFNVDLTSEDQILTLSTCVTGGVMRVVLHAKLISIYI